MRNVKIVLLVATIPVFAACAKPITNQEIIEKTKYCNDNGVGVEIYQTLPEMKITDVVCNPYRKTNQDYK